jgi:hypothetical protein
LKDGTYVASPYVSVGFYTYDLNATGYWGWELIREDAMALPEGCVVPEEPHDTVPIGSAEYDVSTEIECGVAGPSIWFDNVGAKPVDLAISAAPGRMTLQSGGSTMWTWTDSWTAYAPGTDTVVDSGTLTNAC